MARIIINTRKEGQMSFWCKADGSFAWLESEGKPGTLGQPICKGGGFRGSAIYAREETLADVARKWLRQRREAERKAMA